MKERKRMKDKVRENERIMRKKKDKDDITYIFKK